MSDRSPPVTNEQRRHQRIGFDEPLPISIGHRGERSVGSLENLSLGGLMFRSKLQLSVGETIGCEFCVFDSPLIDIVATVASKVGEGLYGVRFQAGPMSQHLIDDAINSAIHKGKATIISIHNVSGSKVMRVAGGLTAANSNDFLHAVERVGVAEIGPVRGHADRQGRRRPVCARRNPLWHQRRAPLALRPRSLESSLRWLRSYPGRS